MDYLTILLAAVASMVLGFLWYGPVFGKPWMKAMGKSEADMAQAKSKGMAKMMLINFVATLVMAWVLNLVEDRTGAMSLMSALKWAGVLWLGFMAPVELNDVLFGGRSVKVFVINAGYLLVSMLAMAAVLVLV